MNTRVWKLLHLRAAGFAVGAVAIAGIAVVATASAAGMSFGFRPSATQSSQSNDAALTAVQARATSAACGEFMKHFAVEIGKSQADINSAFQRAIADTLVDEVKAGHLTQAQADAIKQKLAGQSPCTLPSLAPRGDKTAIGAYMAQYLTAAASALGISETQLKTDLKNGQSLSQVALAQKVSEADFRTRLIAKLKPVLDQAVSDKKITSAQEQAIVNRLQAAPLPLWNRPEKHKPTPAATPSSG
ncbi:MAG TPA: hypothetical protein VEM94_04030 [Candidatus Dormibacteraeota bacterium]|nr:hypothetical protein [Candidatus Dormibacteraeota bacterium]